MEIEDIVPATLKPEPNTVAWVIITPVVPVLVRVNVWELFEPGATAPKTRLVVLAASTPGVAPFEVVFAGAPALVSPMQPEVVRVVMNRVAIMANNARRVCCFGS